MAFTIPSDYFDKYYEVADELLTNTHISEECTVNYPPSKVQCPNCITNTMLGGGGSNVYRSGGPTPFSLGNCPLCHGVGFKETPQTDVIRLRVYREPKSWIKIAGVEIADGRVQVIGWMNDAPKLKRSDDIILFSDLTRIETWRYKLGTPVFPHGFGTKYFLAFLDRA